MNWVMLSPLGLASLVVFGAWLWREHGRHRPPLRGRDGDGILPLTEARLRETGWYEKDGKWWRKTGANGAPSSAQPSSRGRAKRR